MGLAFASLVSNPAQAAICSATAINDFDVFISLNVRGQSWERISLRIAPLDESREKRLRLPRGKQTSGRKGEWATRCIGGTKRICHFMAGVFGNADTPPPLHSFGLEQTVSSMEVDFQAIKVEDLKSRLGELRRYL
jgi:hypothetical protein